jgi:hypothetical protein
MKTRFQFAACALVLGLGTVIAVPSFAQRARPNPGPQGRPPRAEQRRQDRPPQRQQGNRAGQPGRGQNGNATNPQGSGGNRPNSVMPPNNNSNRPPSAYTPPAAPQRKFNELSPADQKRVLENSRKYQNLTPAQKQDMQDRINAWNRLTPTQQNHIKTDVMPKWREMPTDRRQAIRQRLRVLQNMPESARNRRLNDPEFTRGMSEEDRATLRDLSHMHVGAPDPPGE